MPSAQQEMRSREAWPRQMTGRQADVSQEGGTRLLSRKRKADVSGGEVAVEMLPELSRKVFVATVNPPQPHQHLRDNSPTPPTRHATGCKQKSYKSAQARFPAKLSPQPSQEPPKTDMPHVHVAVDSELPNTGLQEWQYRESEHCRKQGALSKVQSSWSATHAGVQRAPQAVETRPPGKDLLKTEEQVHGDCEDYPPQISRSQHSRGDYQSSVDDLLAYGPAILLTQNNNSLPAGRHVTSRGQGRRRRNCREVQTNMNFSQQLDGEYVFEYNYRRRQVFLPHLSSSHTPNRLKNHAGERFYNEYDPQIKSVSVSKRLHHLGKCLDYECLRRRGEALHDDIVRSLNLLNKTWATGGSREGTNVATTSRNDGKKGQGAFQQTAMPQPDVVTVSRPSQVFLMTGKDNGKESFDKRPDDNVSCKYSVDHKNAPHTPTSIPNASQINASWGGGSERHLTCEEKIARSCTANKECLTTRQGHSDGSQPSKGRQQEVAGQKGNVSSQSLHDALLTRRLITGHITATLHNGFQNQTASTNQARVQSGEKRTQLGGDSKAAPGTLRSKEDAVATKATNLSSPFGSNVSKYPTSQSMSLAVHGSGEHKSLSASKLLAFCDSNLRKSSIRGSSLAAFPLHRNRSPPSRGSRYTASKSSFPYIAATSPSGTVSHSGPTNPPRFLAASSIKACVSSDLNRKQSSCPTVTISQLTNDRKRLPSALSANQLTAFPRTPISALSLDSGNKQPPDSPRKESSLLAKTALSSASTVDGPFRFPYSSKSFLHCEYSSSANAAHDPSSSVTLTRTAAKDCTSPRTTARTASHSTSPAMSSVVSPRSVVSGPSSPEILISPGKQRSTRETSSNIAMSVVSGSSSPKISPNTTLFDPMSPRTPTKTASRERTSPRTSPRSAVVTNPSVRAFPQSPRDASTTQASVCAERGGCDWPEVLSDPDSPPAHLTTSLASNTSFNKPTAFSASLREPVTSDLSISRHSDPLFSATSRAQDQCVEVELNLNQGRSRTGFGTDSSDRDSTTDGSREMVVRQPDQDRCGGSAEHAHGVRAQADETAVTTADKWALCPGTWGTLRRLLVLVLPLAFLLSSLTSRQCTITGEPFLRLERVLDDVLGHLSLHHVAPPAM